MADVAGAVEDDYAVSGMAARIVAALREAGVGPGALTPEILAPIDQIHGGGLAATRSHAALVEIAADMRLLDIGCGIGGPARYFAGEFGCLVTGIDLTREYIEVAEMLTERSGLGHLVDFRCADATNLPFNEAAFDMVWSLNVTMNIGDRSALYAEVKRVLKPGGAFCVSEIGLGPAGDPSYPLPWARDPSYSFLVPPVEMRAQLEAAGFRIAEWVDETRARRQAGGRPAAGKGPAGPLTIELVRGPDYPVRQANSGRGIREDRLTSIKLVARRV